MIDKKLYRPSTIQRWIVIVFERPQRFSQGAADDMINGLRRATSDMGTLSSISSSRMPPLIIIRYQWLCRPAQGCMGEPAIGHHCRT